MPVFPAVSLFDTVERSHVPRCPPADSRRRVSLVSTKRCSGHRRGIKSFVLFPGTGANHADRSDPVGLGVGAAGGAHRGLGHLVPRSKLVEEYREMYFRGGVETSLDNVRGEVEVVAGETATQERVEEERARLASQASVFVSKACSCTPVVEIFYCSRDPAELLPPCGRSGVRRETKRVLLVRESIADPCGGTRLVVSGHGK